MPDRARPLIVGNWKMNGLRQDLGQAKRLADTLERRALAVRVVLCPPATLLSAMSELLRGSPVGVGGQDCHTAPAGAHTGDVSAPMLADAGAAYVIVGHSERRLGHGETDALVAAKALAAVRAGLVPIVCLGGATEPLIQAQTAGSVPSSLSGDAFVVAYEPLMPAGGDETASIGAIARAHGAIRAVLMARHGESGSQTPILYAGSVGAAAVAGAAQGVGGLLVGEASLQAHTFLPIIQAADRAAREAPVGASTVGALKHGGS